MRAPQLFAALLTTGLVAACGGHAADSPPPAAAPVAVATATAGASAPSASIAAPPESAGAPSATTTSPPARAVPPELVEAARQEARNALGQLVKDASAAYEREEMSPTLQIDVAAPLAHQLCKSASTPVPASARAIAALKYQSTSDEWFTDRTKRNVGFACLKFALSAPQILQYDYQMDGDGASEGSSFRAIAHGDLDGDGVLSTFTWGGHLVKGAHGLGVVIDAEMTEHDPAE
jgi:type IV pilus assembly protein PilA